MGILKSDHYQDLRAFLVNQVKDLYDAEFQLIAFLPEMIMRAKSLHLRTTLNIHLCESYSHIDILEAVFSSIDEEPNRARCFTVEKIIRSYVGLLESNVPSSTVADAGLILVTGKIQHYQVAGYRGILNICSQMGELQVSELLGDMLPTMPSCPRLSCDSDHEFPNSLAINM